MEVLIVGEWIKFSNDKDELEYEPPKRKRTRKQLEAKRKATKGDGDYERGFRKALTWVLRDNYRERKGGT